MSVEAIPKPVRAFLKRIPGVLPTWQFVRYALPHRIWRRCHAGDLRIVEGLPLFTPSSGGDIAARAALTFESANLTVPLLARLARPCHGFTHIEPLALGSVASEPAAAAAAAELEALFVTRRSDKSTVHDYHHLYGALLRRRAEVTKVLEIGIGTNNEDVVSNMSRDGTPGASLRAFRDFLPNARIFGADLDARVLFQEDRIATFAVDQTNQSSLERLGSQVGDDFDLIIDDGLHAPHANLSVLLFAMPRVKPGGHIVIEDIPRVAAPLWQVVGAIMPVEFECSLFDSRSALLFVARRRPAANA
jgi:hypothetical protein